MLFHFIQIQIIKLQKLSSLALYLDNKWVVGHCVQVTKLIPQVF